MNNERILEIIENEIICYKKWKAKTSVEQVKTYLMNKIDALNDILKLIKKEMKNGD